MKNIIWLVIFILGIPGLMVSQIDYDQVKEPTASLFINDVLLQQGPDQIFGLCGIIIRDGIIIDIGQELSAPFDAKTIEADSAYAYPSFIDLASHVGVAKPERNNERPDVKFPGNPPNKLAGITPEKKLSTGFNLKDSDIKTLRESGYAIAHTFPRGQMLPGQGSLISLHSGSDILLADGVSLFMQFSGVRGLYPGTIIGVMAKWRDLYRNASLLAKHQKSYYDQPLGKTRPTSNQSLEALIPVTQKKMNVYAKAEGVKNVFRALELQKELAYDLVLVNVKKGWPAIDKLKKQNVSVALSLDLPKTEKSDDTNKKGREKGKRKRKERNEE